MIADDSEEAGPGFAGNAEAYSVSELAFALKRTLEDAYGFVRLRGEISKVTRHASGHVYLSIKDDKACIDGVVWRTAVRGLKCQPQTGVEVVVTGKITTYPARSSYQLVIETMAPAGVGALLAQLERLKERLRAEGLFDPARKRALPRHPATIAVVTSPTGAVIRDILHRVSDRWPARVLVWPVVVQGAEAAGQVLQAVEGLNRLGGPGGPPRPDVIIVARGGGSVEDLWPFNDERLARAVAASAIPVISAVGHETDTTLIDFVSDRRAPTPSAAAEIATPVLAELLALVSGLQERMLRSGAGLLEMRRTRLRSAVRGLPRPADLLGFAGQRLDLAQSRLGGALQRNLSVHERALLGVSGRLAPRLLKGRLAASDDRSTALFARAGAAARRSFEAQERELRRLSARLDPRTLARARHLLDARLETLARRLDAAAGRRLERSAERLESLDQLRRSLDPDRPLARGFARIRTQEGRLARSAGDLRPGDPVALVFHDGERHAVVAGAGAPSDRPKGPPRRTSGPDQGDLF